MNSLGAELRSGDIIILKGTGKLFVVECGPGMEIGQPDPSIGGLVVSDASERYIDAMRDIDVQSTRELWSAMGRQIERGKSAEEILERGVRLLRGDGDEEI